MISGTWKIFSMFRDTLAGGDTPRQIAFGIAMGMLIGLVPKDSLFTFGLGLILLISTANLFFALISGFAFSWIGFLVDPYSHSVGKWVLTEPSLQSTWVFLYELPMVPWARFENTVVTGSLCIGLVSFIPVYLVSHALIKKFGPSIHAKLNRYLIYRWISGTELIVEESPALPVTTESLS